MAYSRAQDYTINRDRYLELSVMLGPRLSYKLIYDFCVCLSLNYLLEARLLINKGTVSALKYPFNDKILYNFIAAVKVNSSDHCLRSIRKD